MHDVELSEWRRGSRSRPPNWQGLRHCDKGLTPCVSELLSAVVIPIDTALLFAGRRRLQSPVQQIPDESHVLRFRWALALHHGMSVPFHLCMLISSYLQPD